MIPKIIHQTWKTHDVPDRWGSFVISWQQFHPDWEYMFWTDNDGFDFVNKYFPDFVHFYASCSYNIQRADALRYMLLYHYGGLYVDMDFECLQEFDHLLQESKFIIGLEPESQAKILNHEKLLANALIACQPRHPFMRQVLDHLKTKNPYIVTHADVLRTTGPIMLQEAYQLYGKEDVIALPASSFYPLSNNAPEFKILLQGDDESRDLKQRFVDNGCYAIHYWDNSWMRNLAGDLNNPEPDNIAGYRFFPGRDSHGNDLLNGGRDIKKLAKLCDEAEGSCAFNTDGFIKNRICPVYRLSRIDNPNGNEGIYIKNEFFEQLG